MSDAASSKAPSVTGSLHTVADDSSGVDPLPPPPTFTPEQERKLYRKLDLRLMPILSVMFFLAAMDGGNIGNARIAGLATQLNLVGSDFNLVLTTNSIAYCLCGIPVNFLLKKFRPSRWLAGITVLWGLTMTVMGIVKTYQQLLGIRVFLGIFESGIFPGVAYYLTLWYPRHELQFRMGLFFAGSSLAFGFSGLLAFSIGYMNGVLGLEGWSWIFILEGSTTVVVGLFSVFVLVDYPATAKFLTSEERAFIVWKKTYDNSSVGEQEEFAGRYVWAALLDWQLWLHILIYMSLMTPLAGIALFLPTIIVGFGYSTTYSQLLTMPVYFVATIVALAFGYYSDKTRRRSPFILAGLLQLLVGFSIQISNAPPLFKYFGTYLCVAGSVASIPGAVAWLGNNLAGQCKRGVGMAVHIGIGNLAIVIASNIFRVQDAPRYVMGYAVEFLFVGIGTISTVVAAALYMRINGRRDAQARDVIEKGGRVYTVEELREMGDRAPDFRYTL